jgi:hypothetical protein
MAGRPKRFHKGPSAAEIRAVFEKNKKAQDAEARESLAIIEAHMAARSRAVHRLGVALLTARTRKFFYNLGATSFDEFLARLGIGRSQAWKWMTIATRLSEDEAAALGVEEAYARAVSIRPKKMRARSSKKA